LDVDVLHVVAAVRLADRQVLRRGQSRSRAIHIVAPVHDPDRWSAPRVQRALVRAIEFATGDSWSFSFMHRPQEARNRSLPFLAGLPMSSDVIPYRGGLDSFAALRFVDA